MANIVLTGGGTAGHVFPALALLPELKKHFGGIYFIGDGGMEKELVENAGIPFRETAAAKLERTAVWRNLKIPFVLAKGVRRARQILEETDADVIFSKGGYASLPTCLAGKELRVPIVVHESDYTLGVANKLTSKFAALTLTSFAETKGGEFVGNPVREEILRGNAKNALKLFPVNPEKKTILIFGGSSGAAALNDIVYKGLFALTKKYNVIHMAGKNGDFTRHAPDYFQVPFIYDMGDVYTISDYVVSRGGANTLSELSCLGKKCIVVPLPKGNSRGDQLDNALSYQKRGFVEILPQDNLYVETLLDKIEGIRNKKVPISDVSEINKNIVSKIISVAKKVGL